LKKKPTPAIPNANYSVNFGLVRKSLSELTDADAEQIVDSIKLNRALDANLLSFERYSISRIDKLLGMNIALNSCFYDVDWLTGLRDILRPVTDLFDVFRGMKTGQDDIYYLRSKNDVDGDYVGRVFKSAKSAEYLTAKPDTDSFVCGKTLAELSALGHKKTLAWIERFRRHINQSVPHKDTFCINC
jgi:hypothetical protein